MRFHIGFRGWIFSLFIMLMLIGLGGVVGFSRMEQAIAGILTGNYRAVLAGQELQQNLLALHQGLPGSLAAPLEENKILFNAKLHDLDERFHSLDKKREGNSQDRANLEKCQQTWQQYRQILADFRTGSRDTVPTPESLKARLQPLFGELIPDLQLWTARQETAIEESRNLATAQARNLAMSMGAFTFIGMLVLLYFHHRITIAVIRPANLINRLLIRVNSGDTELRLPELRENYLNQVARSCNRLIEILSEMTEESRRRINLERQITEILIEAIQEPAVVLDMAGELLLANQGARELFLEGEGNQRLNRLREALRKDAPTLTLADRTVTLRRHASREPRQTGIEVVVLS